jgi:hypothetical protein
MHHDLYIGYLGGGEGVSARAHRAESVDFTWAVAVHNHLGTLGWRMRGLYRGYHGAEQTGGWRGANPEEDVLDDAELSLAAQRLMAKAGSNKTKGPSRPWPRPCPGRARGSLTGSCPGCPLTSASCPRLRTRGTRCWSACASCPSRRTTWTSL